MDVWERLYSDYSTLFGKDEAYYFYLADKKRLILLEIQYCLDQDRRTLNKIDLVRDRVEAYEKTKQSTEKTDHLKTIASLEKYLGFSIDTDKCSVLRFYKYIEVMNNEYEQIKNNRSNG